MNEPSTFKEAYETLQRHANALREQTEPNIDTLLQVVEESVAAYRFCQTRLDAVEAALQQALARVEDKPPASSAATKGAPRTAAAADDQPRRASPWL